MSMQASKQGTHLCRWPPLCMLWETKMHMKGVQNTTDSGAMISLQLRHTQYSPLTTLNMHLHLLFSTQFPSGAALSF